MSLERFDHLVDLPGDFDRSTPEEVHEMLLNILDGMDEPDEPEEPLDIEDLLDKHFRG